MKKFLIINLFLAIIVIVIIIIIVKIFKKYIDNYENIELSSNLTSQDIINLKKGQKKMSNLLKELDRICKKYNLKYWCTGGTLIGILRHKGWVPWDGDIDIGMLKDDHDILESVIQKELPKNMWFQNKKTDKRFKNPGLSKIRDINSHYKYAKWATNRDLYMGLQLDIFTFVKKENILKPIFPCNDVKNIDYNMIFPLKEKIFDNIKVYIPNDFINYSKKAWGDYPPPMPDIDKRYPHEGILEPNKASEKMKNRYPHLYV